MKPSVTSGRPHILIFDSGVGGLSILHELQRQIPNCQYSYLSDNAGFPYGDKATDFITNRVNQVLQAFVKQINTSVDLIIIACNTASTIALPTVREQLSIPIVGVVPAIKPAAKSSKNCYMGLLATPATINRTYTKELIAEHAKNCHIVPIGSTQLVMLAEKKLENGKIKPAEIANILAPFNRVTALNPTPEKLDHLILACTHFPLLSKEIQKVMGPQVTLIDSSYAIAKRAQHLLENFNLQSSTPRTWTSALFFTKDNKNIKALQPALKAFNLNACIYLNV